MRRRFPRIRGLGFILWHARHEFYHILLGLVWAWYLRERWGQFNPRWVWLAVFGSLLPDADHLFYFYMYGRNDWYSIQVKKFFRSREWRNLTSFMSNAHKQNTNLATHNIFFMALLLLLAVASSFFEWQTGIILFGAMLTHYLFDIADDLVLLGSLNPNWKRLGRGRKQM